ncbi:hypothetical protein Pcinc_043379 [Petrolisthes cinctipes]|uniref:Pro-resilin n=1 Tax=Petrolisthes cinctipes TaxID=88211 RepID=A0AAE1BFY8_PETCI|nr:hypothetical protein Pcinc_043379 [Petrolisthes cinctipes]
MDRALPGPGCRVLRCPPQLQLQLGCERRRLRQQLRPTGDRNLDDTKGTYSVHLPDGRLQTVNYFVNGDSGFVAEVNYDGEARFSDSFESFESRGGRPRYYN